MTAHRTRTVSGATRAASHLTRDPTTDGAMTDGAMTDAAGAYEAVTRDGDATAGDALTDEDLIAGFRAATLPPSALTHGNHVRLGWLYLRAHPAPRAIEAFSADLIRYAAAIGAPGMYHETITWMYLLVIHERMQRQRLTARPIPPGAAPDRAGCADGPAARGDTGETWGAFAAANPDLLVRGKRLLRRYYTDDTLASDLARRAFVLPDRLR